MPVVDPEVIDLVAEFVRRLTTRHSIAHDDDGSALLKPEDIGVVAFRRYQSGGNVPCRLTSTACVAQEAIAQAAKCGMWTGTFRLP